jgi:hypothetical protein
LNPPGKSAWIARAVSAHAGQRFGEIRPREHHHLRVVEVGEVGKRRFRELAGRRVVADGHERGGEIRHDRGMLRRALDSP